MLIDTGSFQTILPLHILKDDLFATQLKGKPFEVKGYDGITKKHPIFIVDLIIQENTIPKKKVLGINKKTPLGQTPYGLLGRDILSRYMLRCDGPAQKFELELPSP